MPALVALKTEKPEIHGSHKGRAIHQKELPDADEDVRLPTTKKALVRERLFCPEAIRIWDICRAQCPWLTMADFADVETMANHWSVSVRIGRQIDHYLSEGEEEDLRMAAKLRPTWASATSAAHSLQDKLGMSIEGRKRFRDAAKKKAEEADAQDPDEHYFQ